MFATGAAIGSVVTWKVLKEKYERIAQDEIDSVKETLTRRVREESENTISNGDDECEDDEDDEDCSLSEYNSLVGSYAQSGDYAENGERGVGESEVPYINGPYVILPEDFGDGNYEHSLYCLTYYEDGVLANDWDEILDIDETIGEESIQHFGDYVDGVVHVRNERLNADYEIVRDPRNYADVIVNEPLESMHAD
jgi:hypothetical protein